jgi:hypothetical protein
MRNCAGAAPIPKKSYLLPLKDAQAKSSLGSLPGSLCYRRAERAGWVNSETLPLAFASRSRLAILAKASLSLHHAEDGFR